MNKDIVKKFSFTEQERSQLQNIQIGIVNAQATNDGLNIYKNMVLGGVYKRLGIEGDPLKGHSKTIQYNLGKNEIVYTQSPIKEKNAIVKK